MAAMLDEASARDIVDRIDLRRLPICTLCHLELAFAIRDGEPRRVLAPFVTRATGFVWAEIADDLEAQLRREAMRGAEWARDALEDLDQRRARSWIVRVIVMRVASVMADDLRRTPLEPRPVVLTLPAMSQNSVH